MAEREPDILAMLQEFLAASTGPDETERVLLARPGLQSLTVDAALAELITAARAEGDEDSVRILAGRRAILEACRELGTSRAIAMMHGQFLMQRLVEARTAAAKRQVIEECPRIFEDGPLALRQAIKTARGMGDQQAVRMFQSHLALLALCKAEGIANGIAAAFPD
jgi:hypothetical protein